MNDEAEVRQTQRALPPGRSFLHRHWRISAGVIAALVLALALGLWLRSRRLPPEPPLPDLTGAYPEVVELIEEARAEVLRQRSSSASWGRLGKLLYAHQFMKEAIRCFQQAELLDPREPAWPYLHGLIVISETPDDGILLLERAVQSRANGPIDVRLRLAEALLDQNRLDEAQSHLEQTRQLDSDNPRARLGLGRLALLRENWQTGLEQLEACQDDVHARRLAHGLQAEAWNRLGQPERARAEQRLAAELLADEPWPDPFFDEVVKLQRGLRARLTEALSLSKVGRVEETVNLLRQTLDKYPTSLEAWMQLGDVWFRLQTLDEAEACFQKAVQIAPEAAEAWYRLGYTQAQAKSPEAAASLHRAIRLSPDHALAHFSLGVLLKEQGKPDDAAAEFRAALRHRPDYEPARTALSELEPRAKKAR